ncbi:MAG: PH domain-containing protein [Rhodospirillales bacterium]|nr:PH domain-containing protein [Rhodospirillales bacterium]
MMTFLGVMIFVIHLLKVIATEIALTDQRLIYKTGLIFVDVKEIDLAEIRSETVHHGLLGRFLRYGEVHLDSRFVGDIYLPAMVKPYILLKDIHAARRKLPDPLDD